MEALVGNHIDESFGGIGVNHRLAILIRRKGKSGDTEIPDIAGLRRIWFFFADQSISAEIPDVRSA
jgi:hypothetical protein